MLNYLAAVHFATSFHLGLTMGKNSGKRSAKGKIQKTPKRRGWTSDEQFKYLNDLLMSFKAAQANNTTSKIWSPIENYWFGRWPLPSPTEDEVKQGLTEQEQRTKVMDVSGFCLHQVRILTFFSIAH